jgi:hypothetical protein
VPGAGDVVYSSGNTVTIDADVTCALITTDSPIEGQFTGGTFILEDGVTFIGDIAAKTNTCLKFSGTNSTIIGSISGGDGGYMAGVVNLGYGALKVIETSFIYSKQGLEALSSGEEHALAGELSRGGHSTSLFVSASGDAKRKPMGQSGELIYLRC